MDTKTAKALLPLVNDPDRYPLLQIYVDMRIETIRGYLETATEHSKVISMQGEITELRRMRTLREQAIEASR